MRPLILIPMLLLSSPAQAHIGHLAVSSGHGHWLGLAVIALAATLGLWRTRPNATSKRAGL